MDDVYPKTMAGTTRPGFFIGGYTLYDGYGGGDRVWIEKDGGEGADFSAEALEALIAQFYADNF